MIPKHHMIIDSREPMDIRNTIIRLLRSKGAIVTVQKLEAGDYESDSCIIERKEIKDYVGSFTGSIKGENVYASRIERQMLELTHVSEEKSKPIWVVVHGDIGEIQGWTMDQLCGSIGSMSLRYFANVLVLQPQINYHYVIAKLLLGSSEGNIGMPWNMKYIRTDSRKVGVVASILRISPAIAKRLLDKFGNIKNIFNATEIQLQQVTGIGPVKAKNLHRFINEGA